jgi:hypothetical protein
MGPVTIGSEAVITIGEMARMIVQVASQRITIRHHSRSTSVPASSSENGLRG